MARGGARLGAGRPAGKSANTSPPSTRARARARGGSENHLLVAVRARVSRVGDQRRAPAPNNRLG
jgi:hypothetical protein